MTSPAVRTPSPWLVVLPGLLLAALAARAVVVETRRAETRDRDRARSAAGRVVRSLETLLDEYREGLPSGGTTLTPDVVRARAEFLTDVWLVDAEGRSLEPRRPARDRTDADATLVDDARAVAQRIAEETGDPEAAAALLMGITEAVDDPAAEIDLRLAAATLGAADGGSATVLDDLAAVPGLAEQLPGADEALALTRAMGLAIDALRSGDDTPVDLAWLEEAYARLAGDPWGLGDAAREPLLTLIEEAVQAPLAEHLRVHRRTWNDRRELARSDAVADTLVTHDRDRVDVALHRRVRVQMPDGVHAALLGGRIPVVTVRRRLAEEIEALVADGGLDTVQLLAPDGSEVLGAHAEGARPEDARFPEDVPLAAPLSGWTVRAAAPPSDGWPAIAWWLAGGSLLTTLALCLGAVALARAARRQARLAEDRKRFLDHVAHEIRTPSTALLTLSEQLDAGRVPPERLATYTGHLHAEARRLATLVDETLDLTRLEAGRLTFEKEPVDLRDIVRDAVERAVARNPDVAPPLVELPDAAAPVLADRDAVRRALRNLIDNALQHGRSGAPPRVTLTGDRTLAVTVRDAGPGIAPEHQPHLFERFYRAPQSTHEVKGVGLGLALCREVAEAHDGSLTVTSRPGDGATFVFTLPRADGGDR